MTEKDVGNRNLISDGEELVVDFLRQRNLDKVNLVDSRVHPIDSFYTRYGKRIIDLIIALPAFFILLPFNCVFGICTFLDVGKPVLYKQTRVGKDGKLFTMVKFRNMNEDKDESGKLLPASERITRFGRFMRKHSFDELLNFWPVIRGDMSIIGPRPLPSFFEDRMSNRHKMRHSVRPGLECPYSVPSETDISNYHWKFENDIWYVENVSFITDVKMFIKLVKLALNSSERGSHAGGLSYFVGYDDDCHATSYKKILKTDRYKESLREFADERRGRSSVLPL